MSLEGELRVALRLRGGQVAAVTLSSTRPDVAALLLRGRAQAEVQAAVPRLFAICGRSQAAACALACAAAAGTTLAPQALAHWQAAITAERVREAAWQVLLHWPRWLRTGAEAPEPASLVAARAMQPPSAADGQASAQPWAAHVAAAVFGMAPADWLRADTPGALRDWAGAGRLASARFVHELLLDADEEAAAGTAAPQVGEPNIKPNIEPNSEQIALLPAQPDTAWLQTLADALQADPAYERAPLWQGRPAETGALARLQQDALVRALAGLPGQPGAAATRCGPAARIAARYVARLRELAQLLTGATTPQAGAWRAANGSGLAWVHNARGLLVHQVQLQQGRVAAYRIVAPTEWNFHPAGELPRALAGAPAGDCAALQARATRLIHSLDPCVACRVEMQDA